MPLAPTARLEARQAAVRRQLVARTLDALVITSLPNILYLTNFTGSSAIVVLTADRLLFITDFRYVAVIEESRGTAYECPRLDLVVVDGSYDEALAKTLAPFGRAGIEAAHLAVSRYDWLRAHLPADDPATTVTLVSTEGVVEQVRMVKDASEIETLREAGRLISRVTREVLPTIRAGQSERDVALLIDTAMRRHGFERAAFDTIVAAGPNGALPHAHPGERKLTEGDLVVLDFGGVYDSYCVDLTRTVSVGRASARAREVYDAVRRAHDLAVAAVAPGALPSEIDGAARTSLGAAGMADAFGHSTGHGLGIEVHEGPRIGKRGPELTEAETAVAAGYVFTIEPGAYFPGWGGVRIEDDVLVTETGVELLTDVETELVEL
jgi:Xaa-Pro aminopeptidase